jgi:uncharacterized phage infection (PIP) family protein YhgE
MISLSGLMGDSVKLGKMDVKLGQVVSNPYARAFAPQVNEGEESQDHEVSMANNSLDTIIKMATELKAKMGKEEKQIPAWIQDHITNAENYISQASSNYHEYGDSNEDVNEARGVAGIQNDYKKVLDSIQSELEKFKLNKGTDKAKQNVENLKKLNVQKVKLEDELNAKVDSLYKDYDLDMLNSFKTLKRR